jgi:hypothetical protein
MTRRPAGETRVMTGPEERPSLRAAIGSSTSTNRGTEKRAPAAGAGLAKSLLQPGPTAQIAQQRQASIHAQVDVLTATYCQWPYRHLHRAMVALDALMHTPPLSEPQFKPGQSPHEYSMAVSLWMLQWSIESEEARFAREMLIPVEGGIGVSLRAYVRGLVARMTAAGRVGIFDDLDGDDSAAKLKDAEKAQLVLEARACLTFALAHDVRWRRVVMRTPVHLFRECPPANDARTRQFIDLCVQLTGRFIHGELSLAEVAEAATRAWLYD